MKFKYKLAYKNGLFYRLFSIYQVLWVMYKIFSLSSTYINRTAEFIFTYIYTKTRFTTSIE